MNVNVYETIVIFDASLGDEATEAAIAKVAELITSGGGEILKTDVWGRRRMAYEINKHTRGNFVLYLHRSPSDLILKLEKSFKVNDQVIKFMNVRLEKKQSAAAVRAAEAAAEAPVEAPAAETAEAPAAEAAPAAGAESPAE
jgi:small subunit ribosomal protein S6